MPNWVRNVVTIQNKQAIKDCVVDDEGMPLFDFQRIIPMPEELNEDSDRYIEKLSMAERLLFQDKYGDVDNWYDWRVKNWGTKWNANETVVLSDNKVMFDTAWSTPFRIFEEISKRYNTIVKVRYADEGITENSGLLIYDKGVEIYYKKGDRRFCRRVWDTTCGKLNNY